MKKRGMVKIFVISGAVICSLVLFSSNAFAWGSITHALIDDNLGKKTEMCNLNEIYGGMAADIFNLSPDVLDPESPIFYLYSKAHFDSLELWASTQRARISKLGMAAAYGFVSHDNRILGADYTAHVAYDGGPGYVIAKAEVLFNIGTPDLSTIGQKLMELLDLPDPVKEEVARELCHILIEYAIDIMVAYNPDVGCNIAKKAISSSVLRSPEFPFLLVKAYAGGLSRFAHINRFKAARMILSAEREFRKTVLVYGQALNQSDMNDAVTSVAMLLASLDQEIYGIVPGGELPEGAIVNLARDGLNAAMLVCGPDYSAAIQNTVEYVKKQMNDNGIRY